MSFISNIFNDKIHRRILKLTKFAGQAYIGEAKGTSEWSPTWDIFETMKKK